MNFTIRELYAARLSTAQSPTAYKPAMSDALRSYVAAERGRAARLADALDISRSYMSDLASGKKMASVPLLRRISQATGVSIGDLMGQQGMSEGAAEPYLPGPKDNRLRDLTATLFPGMRHASYYIASSANTAFGILPGDMMVTEASFSTDKIDHGKLVVSRISDDTGSVQTVIGRVAAPWIIDANGHIAGEIGVTASIVGLIHIVLRSDDPAAF
jgi:transcriptional regulator with XRE-family HTH domain